MFNELKQTNMKKNILSSLNVKRFFEQRIIKQKEKTQTKDEAQKISSVKKDEKPYYEIFISRHKNNHDDFLDYSGGMLGI